MRLWITIGAPIALGILLSAYPIYWRLAPIPRNVNPHPVIPTRDLINTNAFLENPQLVWFSLRSIAAVEHDYTNRYGVAGAQQFNHWDEDRRMLTNIFPNGFPPEGVFVTNPPLSLFWQTNRP